MRKQKFLPLVIFAAVILACLQTAALGQTANDGKLANVTGGGSSVRWDMVASQSGGSLTISAPDGRVFHREFRAGASPDFTLIDNQGERLPDGTYTYELRLAPASSLGIKDTLKAARPRDDDPEAERVGRKRAVLPALVQSGSFMILNGSVIVAGSTEEPQANRKVISQQQFTGFTSGNAAARLRQHQHSLLVRAMPDVVTADDEIIQGSLCVGLDCVNGESFSFDTIRLKENNTRISFVDTSAAAGFPTNDWTIRANSSSSGGASFLAFVDRGASSVGDETGTIVFEVDAGAPANAVKVSNTGKVGFRTATPVLDLHMNTTDTPAVRFEQNSGGGFSAQTWDVAGNEANFFVRDVTGGSRLPLRIRPGAPTSSIDIAASGNVGIGTASPTQLLHVLKSQNANTILLVTNSTSGTGAQADVRVQNDGGTLGQFGIYSSGTTAYGALSASDVHVYSSSSLGLMADNGAGVIKFATGGNSEKMRLTANGRLGIGTSIPDQLLSVNGDASKTGGNTWLAFSDERLKNIKGRFNTGLKAIMRLQPIRYEYKPDNALGLKSEGEHIGFGAQALQKVIPEAVTQNSTGYLMVNSDPIMWTMLNAIKEQQKEIAELRAQVQRLRAASHRRRK